MCFGVLRGGGGGEGGGGGGGGGGGLAGECEWLSLVIFLSVCVGLDECVSCVCM